MPRFVKPWAVQAAEGRPPAISLFHLCDASHWFPVVPVFSAEFQRLFPGKQQPFTHTTVPHSAGCGWQCRIMLQIAAICSQSVVDV